MIASQKSPVQLTSAPSRFVYALTAWGIVLFLVLALFSGNLSVFLKTAVGQGWTNYIDEIFLFGFLLFVGIIIFVTGRTYLSQAYIWLFAVTIIGGLASLLGHVPLRVALAGFLLVIKPLFILIVFQSVPLDKVASERVLKSIKTLFGWLVFSSLAYMFIFELVLGFNPMPGSAPSSLRIGLRPLRSFFTHPSHYSSIMALAALFFFSRFLINGCKKELAPFTFASVGILLALRMKALFLTPLAIIVIYSLVKFKNLRIQWITLVKAILLLLGVGIVVIILTVLLQDVLNLRLEQGVTNVRWLLLKSALVINKNTYGLGAGFGMYGSSVSVTYHYSPLYYEFGIADLYKATPDNPTFITDQWWAWYLGEIGVIGTVVYLFALFQVMYSLTRIANYWAKQNPSLTVLAYTALGALFYGVLSGYAGVYLSAPPTGYYVMALAGLCYALHRGLQRS